MINITNKNQSRQTLNIHLLQGIPEGVKVLEIQNKTLRMYIVPRFYLRYIEDRKDLEQPAIYFLITEDQNQLYVGEAENFYNRILQHSTKEWETALICLSNNNSLDKADVKYLEAYFIRIIKEIDIQLSNGNTPKFNNLHEFRRSATEEFAEYIRIGLASLGYKFLQQISNNLKEKKIKEQDFWYLKARGSDAKGIVIDDGFVLLKGSVINSISTPNFINKFKNFENRRQNILKQKTKILENNLYETLEDINFTSINQAACFVVGNSVNAWVVWKNKEGLTIDEVLRKNKEVI